ncbi:hypothetical protein [Acidaminobacter sp.]|uniref:hypothetical protein n=1 Tax=Acidaminobacter sp. TaxID=1872102 RepID=UPI0013834AC7|nr:hypothetical protein [Acidaminobacter sp.]MDK9709868.1 hypothetical protein [Acidaminobacter sp.]MZQ96653.1 hypothetical protein [Acidaminobacter sp.]
MAMTLTMAWKIKLKEGFFKTVDCELTLDETLLIMTPLEDLHHPSVELELDEIVGITMNRKDQINTEIEIRTKQFIFVAQLLDSMFEEALILELYGVFQSRFQVI